MSDIIRRRRRADRLTIAACYVSPEGVVLGADSTSTYGDAGSRHYYNHAQKLFEVGTDSTVGLVTWGLGGLAVTSYRTLIAKLADDMGGRDRPSVEDAAKRWCEIIWEAYRSSALWAQVEECRVLAQMAPYDPSADPIPEGMRTGKEEHRFTDLKRTYFAGFCLAGYAMPDREPTAYTIALDPLKDIPVPERLDSGAYAWGAPNIIRRQINGYDDSLKAAILRSSHWNGTESDFDAIAGDLALHHPNTVPMREAIDFVYACIFSTIKAFKFSNMPQICGGPIEIAAITADRPFRWVKHKPWDTAINEPGGPYEHR